MFKSFEDFQALSKNGYDAYVASASAMTKGFQAIAQETADFSRKSFEKSTEAVEKATATKSFDKALEVQQGYAKEVYEALVAQTAKLNELYVATAKEAYKPFESTLKAFGVKPIQQ
jgi:phasin family protein